MNDLNAFLKPAPEPTSMFDTDNCDDRCDAFDQSEEPTRCRDYGGACRYRGAMSDRQERDLAGIAELTVLRLAGKYRAGQVEHGGNGWEMGVSQIVGNAIDEVTDLTVYLAWVERALINVTSDLYATKSALERGDTAEAADRVRLALKAVVRNPDRR